MDEKNYEHTPGTIEETAETAEAVTEAAEETACAAASETVAEAADAPEIKAADLAEEIRREAAEPADTASQAGIYGYDPLREEQKANTMREFSSQQTKTAQERWREEAQQYSWRSSHEDSDGLKNSERETFNPRTGMYEAPGAAASAGAPRSTASCRVSPPSVRKSAYSALRSPTVKARTGVSPARVNLAPLLPAATPPALPPLSRSTASAKRRA